MFPPFGYSFKDDVPFLKYDLYKIRETFPNWLFDATGFALSDDFKKYKKPEVNINFEQYPKRCYILAPGTEQVLALFSPLNEDDFSFLANAKQYRLTSPKRHWDLNNLFENYHENDNSFEEMIEMMLVNPSCWLFDGAKLKKCFLIHQFGLAALLEMFHNKNILSLEKYLTTR